MSYPDVADLETVQVKINQLPYAPHPEDWEDITIRAQGDCKDYVLGKLHALLDLGWPIETLQIGICLVEPENRIEGQTHAVLLVHRKYVLDNRQTGLCTLDELDRIGYQPVEIQKEGGSRTFVEWRWA